MGCRNGAQGRGHSPSPTPPKTREGRARWAWTGGLARSAAGSLGPGPCSSARPSSRSTRPRAASLPGGPSRILSVKIQPQCVETSSVCTNRKPRCVTHYPNTSSALSTPVLRDFRERKAPEGQGPSLIIPFPSLWPKCLANRWRDTFRKNEHKHDHVGICRRLCKAH